MLLKVKILGIDSSGKPIVFLNKQDADDLGITSSGRVQMSSKGIAVTAIVNITSFIKKGFVVVSEEIHKRLDLKRGDVVNVDVAAFPKSLQFIRNKLAGKKLLYDEVHEIVKDVIGDNLNESEIAAFVTALHIQGLDLDEATNLASSMVQTGKQLDLDTKVIVDKHSVGGVPGDKTTLLVVPIIAAAGLVIPKTSSRAITSAGGTADRAEVLMPVDLGIKEMKNVIKKCNGCIVWGGSLDLAPADDIFVKVEYSLSIDPLLLPSIMSKKKAVGITHLVIDIPTGRGAKIKTIGEADLLAKDAIEIGRRLGINSQCLVTYGEQPLGLTMGPLLEAKEALEVMMNKSTMPDLVDKTCHLAGTIFEMIGKKSGYNLAKEILRTGKAEKKLREIISLQGGNPNILPDDLAPGKHSIQVRAKNSGRVLWIDNNLLVSVARAAGAPKDKGAGIIFNKKRDNKVKKDEILFTVYAEKSRKLVRVEEILELENPVGVGNRMKMVMHQVKEAPFVKRAFVLER